MSAPAVTSPQLEGPTAVGSDLLGTLQVPPAAVIRFPSGLYGFPECRAFAFLPSPRDGVFWLQSMDFSALAFVLVDPFLYFPEYHIDLDDADIARLGTRESHHILVLSIATMPVAPGAPFTANLNAPLLFNVRDRQAHQSIRADGGHDLRAPFRIEHPLGSALAAPRA